jgi:hypothetical protein
MPQGKPTKWATARINEPISLGKAGISIVIWDKWGRKRRGTLVVSVGGIRWYPYKTWKRSSKTNDRRIRWDDLDTRT